MTIQIQGLTAKQVAMLDIMWSMQNLEEVEDWQSMLDHDDRVMAQTLMHMIMLELLDEVTADDFAEANTVLDKFRS